MNLFKYIPDMEQWERVDRVQEYKGVMIETVVSHADYYGAPRHREYRVTWADGRESWFPINKRAGGNIKDLKQYIDIKTRAAQ